MEVSVSKMLSVTVVAGFVLLGNAHAGYIPRTNILFEIPKVAPNLQEELKQKTLQENLKYQRLENVFSYSLPFEDYNFLRQHKIEHEQIGDMPKGTYPEHKTASSTVSISAVNTLTAPSSVTHIESENLHYLKPVNYQSNLAVASLQSKFTPPINQQSNLLLSTDQHTTIPIININSVNIPAPLSQQRIVDNIPTVNLPLLTNQQSNLKFSTVPYINIQSENVPTVDASILKQSNVEFTKELHAINHDISDLNDSIIKKKAVPLQITKDIYFHAPPPEFEEPVLIPIITPRKKIYKIIFIKLPSQEARKTAQVLRNVYNQVPSITDKTIIYVLSKKPETQPVYLPKPAPSEHEVLFVKYGRSSNIPTTQFNKDLRQHDSELLAIPRLQPGLINGKR